jgi:hypothetical protein
MFEPKNKIRHSILIDRIKEIYQNHPNMQGVNALKEQLKQEKLQDKIYCQSIKDKRPTYQ